MGRLAQPESYAHTTGGSENALPDGLMELMARFVTITQHKHADGSVSRVVTWEAGTFLLEKAAGSNSWDIYDHLGSAVAFGTTAADALQLAAMIV